MRQRRASTPFKGHLLLLLLICPAVRAATEQGAPAGEQVSTESIDNTPMPPTVEAAYPEILRNNEMIAKLQEAINEKSRLLAEEKGRYDDQRKALETSLRLLASTAGKCPAGQQAKVEAEGRKRQLDELRQMLRVINRLVKGDPMIFLPRIEDDMKALCDPKAELRILKDDKITEALGQIDAMREAWIKLAQQEMERNQKLKGARERLRDRLDQEVLKMKTQAAKESTYVSDIKWLVGILGLLSVMVMGIITRYPEQLQNEWVASGQVIQFMTVLIILIAILTLGMAGHLKENTLGTLLGGIGGYVLAQGVGRAAARSAVKQVRRQDEGGPDEKKSD